MGLDSQRARFPNERRQVGSYVTVRLARDRRQRLGVDRVWDRTKERGKNGQTSDRVGYTLLFKELTSSE